MNSSCTGIRQFHWKESYTAHLQKKSSLPWTICRINPPGAGKTFLEKNRLSLAEFSNFQYNSS